MLTGKISLSGCLYFVRYWTISVLRQKFEYLENKKSFIDEIKAFLIIFKGLSLKQKKTIFFGR